MKGVPALPLMCYLVAIARPLRRRPEVFLRRYHLSQTHCFTQEIPGLDSPRPTRRYPPKHATQQVGSGLGNSTPERRRRIFPLATRGVLGPLTLSPEYRQEHVIGSCFHRADVFLKTTSHHMLKIPAPRFNDSTLQLVAQSQSCHHEPRHQRRPTEGRDDVADHGGQRRLNFPCTRQTTTFFSFLCVISPCCLSLPYASRFMMWLPPMMACSLHQSSITTPPLSLYNN